MSIDYPASLKAVGGARTGIAPMNLLDVQDVNGNLYYWADRLCNAPVAISGVIEVNAAPPVEPAAGQYVTWAFAGTATPTVGNPGAGSVTNLTNQTATIDQTLSAPLGNTNEKVVWSNFSMPALPPGAVIDAMYPVAVMTGVGTNDALNSSSFAIPSSGEFDAQYNNGSIGTTLAELQGLSLFVGMAASVPGEGTFFQQIIVSFIGVAVYYHLSTSAGSGSGSGSSDAGTYKPWLLSVPSFTFHRSLVTDIGSFTIQNISGDTLSRDMEKLLRASALEGAFFIYRLWQPDAEAAWLEVHGQLTVEDDGVDTITLKGEQLINASQDDTPLEIYCETCQIQWAGKRCGSTQTTECLYSIQTCQVPTRIMIASNDYEKNFGETTANTALNVINRRRRI